MTGTDSAARQGQAAASARISRTRGFGCTCDRPFLFSTVIKSRVTPDLSEAGCVLLGAIYTLPLSGLCFLIKESKS